MAYEGILCATNSVQIVLSQLQLSIITLYFSKLSQFNKLQKILVCYQPQPISIELMVKYKLLKPLRNQANLA